jgi:transcription initiation factor TFIID TATA-box-binding protein
MKITNIVSTTSVNTNLDLVRITQENDDIIYNPQRFTAAVWRHKRINGTLMLFSTGKIVHLGKPDDQEPRVHIRRYARILQKQNHPIQLSPVRLVCMSTVYRLSGKIDLMAVAQQYNGSYEPEVLNAAILKRRPFAVSVFHTGTLIFTGVTNASLDDAYGLALELELLTL